MGRRADQPDRPSPVLRGAAGGDRGVHAHPGRERRAGKLRRGGREPGGLLRGCLRPRPLPFAGDADGGAAGGPLAGLRGQGGGGRLPGHYRRRGCGSRRPLYAGQGVGGVRKGLRQLCLPPAGYLNPGRQGLEFAGSHRDGGAAVYGIPLRAVLPAFRRGGGLQRHGPPVPAVPDAGAGGGPNGRPADPPAEYDRGVCAAGVGARLYGGAFPLGHDL